MRLFERELTEREEEVLAFLAQGKTNQEIAAELCISVHTVHYHQKSIFCKLEVSKRGEAGMRYWQRLQNREVG